MNSENLWPALPYGKWKDTLDTLHMKMQIIGKVKLALTPYLNHWWNTAFYVNASGITTGLIPYKNSAFEINFDFITHNLFIRCADNQMKAIALSPSSVAEFYGEFMSALEQMGISVKINTIPAEVQNPVPCDVDGRSSYDKDYVHRWWKVLLQSNMIFERFRTPFRGKSSPVHFFWGSFDLGHARYSGKPAIPPNYGGKIMKFAENEENFACGFWAGNTNYPKPAFYSYIYPAPQGIESITLKPQAVSFNVKLGIFTLDYDDVRNSDTPKKLIMDFLNSTYEGSAKLAGWNTESLKAEIPDK